MKLCSNRFLLLRRRNDSFITAVISKEETTEKSLASMNRFLLAHSSK